MANAYVEWDHGEDWTLEQYEEYLKYLEIAGSQDWHWTEYHTKLREANHRMGFPGPAGEML